MKSCRSDPATGGSGRSFTACARSAKRWIMASTSNSAIRGGYPYVDRTSPPWNGSGTGEYRRRRGGGAARRAARDQPLSPLAGGEGGRSLPPWLCPLEPEARGEGPCRRSEAEAGGRGQSFPPTKPLTRHHDAWPAMVSVTISRLPRTSLFQNRITR